MSSTPRAGCIAIAALVGACAAVPQAPPQWGPALRGPPTGRFERAPTLPAGTAGGPFAVTTRRVDLALAGQQNWEPSLAVVRAGAQSSTGDTVAVLWMTGVAGADGLTRTGLAAARSSDGFRTFATTSVDGPAGLAGIPFDPMTIADVADGRLFRGAMVRAGPPGDRPGLWVEADAAPTIASTDPRVDKGWLAAGPRIAGQPGRMLYVAYNLGVQRSLDAGASFSAPVPLPSGASLPHPRVFADGRLGMAYFRSAGNEARFAVSADEARTWTVDTSLHAFSIPFATLSAAVPGEFRIAPLPVWARDPASGALYAVMPDVTATSGGERDLDLVLYRSGDEGRSWFRSPIELGAPPFSDQFAPWIEVDGAGRVHLAWLETRPTAAGDAAPTSAVHAWYARSDDRGATWTSQRLTDAPVESGDTQWSPIAPSPNLQFVGDYLALDVSAHAAYVAHPATFDAAVAMAVSRIEFSPASDTVADPRGLAGAWYDPTTSGQGLSMLWIPGGTLVVTYYGYRNDGGNLWLLGVRAGPIRFGETLQIPMDLSRGGRFGAFQPSDVVTRRWGTLTLRFDGCASASATLDGEDGRQTLALVKLAGIEGLGCD
jgi:hypothetical protein